MRPRGREFASAAFVFPAPEFEVIAPSAKDVSRADGISEEGEPGIDLSARRLLL